MNPKVDWFFAKDTKWQKEYEKLRTIILDCGLMEELKWGCPCYTFENTNIVLIHGFKVKLKKTSEFKVPEDFQKRLDKNKVLKKAFGALTPGRQRAYIFYFSQAKQPKTREARVEKYIKQILSGKGLDD